MLEEESRAKERLGFSIWEELSEEPELLRGGIEFVLGDTINQSHVPQTIPGSMKRAEYREPSSTRISRLLLDELTVIGGASSLAIRRPTDFAF